MNEALNWTIKKIRNDDMMLNWLEEYKSNWVPLAVNAAKNIINGQTLIIVTDQKRAWFSNYVLKNINSSLQKRPMISFIDIHSIYSDFDTIKNSEELDMLSDYIKLTYRSHFFWYIGLGEHKNADITKKKDNNFLWLIDEDYRNSFYFKSMDKHLDIKLIQLYKIFDEMLDAIIFAELKI